MENTEKVHFDDETPQWYIALSDHWIGPMTSSDVYEKIQANEITWAHFVWKPGQSEWKRICDIKTFQTAVPQSPPKAMKEEIKEASKPTIKKAQPRGKAQTPPPPGMATHKKWFLFYGDTQYGPFAEDEVERLLRIEKINGKVFAWSDGMSNWTPIEKITELSKAMKSVKGKSPVKIELRNAPRKPLVAKILLANEKNVSVAMCRDVSIGGMQVLTDQIPGAVNSHVKLNVTPVGEGGIEPFVAEGVIVRLLEDRRGFSFRFDHLSDAAKKAIENYIR